MDLNEAVQVLQLENVYGSLPDNGQVTILFRYHCTNRCCTINRCLLTIPVEGVGESPLIWLKSLHSLSECK